MQVRTGWITKAQTIENRLIELRQSEEQLSKQIEEKNLHIQKLIHRCLKLKDKRMIL